MTEEKSEFSKSLEQLFENSPAYQIERKISPLRKLAENPNSDWQEQHDIEKKIYNDALLLDKHLWFKKHPRFIRILISEGIIKRTVPVSNFYILLRHEAVLYFIWQEFFNYEKAEDFFKIFLDKDGNPIDKKRLNSIRQNQNKYGSKHALSADLMERLYKVINE